MLRTCSKANLSVSDVCDSIGYSSFKLAIVVSPICRKVESSCPLGKVIPAENQGESTLCIMKSVDKYGRVASLLEIARTSAYRRIQDFWCIEPYRTSGRP